MRFPVRPLAAVLSSAVVTTLACATFTAGTPAAAAPGSPAVRPPLGWNSWNTFGCDINEEKIRGAADAMVDSGMKAAGYEYVVVDDCWQATTRDTAGNLRSDPVRWTPQADGTVRGTQSGRCLDVNQAATANNSTLVLWTCSAAPNQRWSKV